MLTRIVFAAAVLLAAGVACCGAEDKGDDDKLVQDLQGVATEHANTLAVRTAALDALAKLGPRAKAAVPALVKIIGESGLQMEDADALLFHLAQTLAAIGPDSRPAVAALVQVKGNHSENTMIAIENAVATILAPPVPAAPKPTAALLLDLKDKDESVRLMAAKALAKRGADAATVLPALLAAMKDADPDVSRVAGDSAAKVREAAAGSTKEYVAQLVTMLKDKDPAVRVLAAKTLGLLGPDAAAALPDLNTVAAQDMDPDAKQVAKNAIEKIQPKDGKN